MRVSSARSRWKTSALLFDRWSRPLARPEQAHSRLRRSDVLADPGQVDRMYKAAQGMRPAIRSWFGDGVLLNPRAPRQCEPSPRVEPRALQMAPSPFLQEVRQVRA